MKDISLPKRLLAAAGLINKNSAVADIGTDHGFLPIWLVQNGICLKPIACDLREGPLSQARKFACKYGVDKSISFRLGDGLDQVSPDEIDTIVIAGMGGETIINILKAATWLFDGEYSLILQPQSKLPELMQWLNETGWTVSAARLAEDDGRIYITVHAQRGQPPKLLPGQLYVPDYAMDSSEPLFERYLEDAISKNERILKALGTAGTEQANERRERLAEAVRDLQSMKKRRLERE